MLIDTWHSVDAIDPDASSTIWLVGDQNEIVWPGAHVEECFELTLRKQATARNVPHRVLGDALWVQDDVRRELSYFRRNSRPHLVCDKHREPAVVVRAHMSADTLEELRLASRAVLLGRGVAMEVDVVHDQARTAGPLLEIFKLYRQSRPRRYRSRRSRGHRP
eukprot:COSAG06_NODE_30338_length_540_cov_1.444444_1_plen_162_part_01